MTQQDLSRQLTDHKFAIDQASIVAITDAKGVITSVNDRFCEISGYAREELIGKTHSILNSKLHPPEFFHALWKTILSGKVWNGEIRNRRKDGEFYWVETTIIPFRNSQGEIFQFLSIRHEITELKRAQQVILDQQARLSVASKFSALGELAANLTHELNNPLSAILGRCEILMHQLQKGQVDPEYIKKGIESIEFTARRIEKITKSMRSFSMADEGDPFEVVTIKSLVEETIEFVHQRYKDFGIHLVVVPIPEDISLECRVTEISQILLNLLNNSFDAIKEHGEPWIKLEVHPISSQAFQLWITDSGNGIPPSVMEKVFDPFFSTKEKQYGTGLGLSISKGLTERHGGTLEVDTLCSNTRFVMTLPFRRKIRLE